MGLSSTSQVGVLGLTSGQFWIVFIAAQIGLLLWLGRRASASANQTQPSNPVERNLTAAQWRVRMVEHRIKHLKTKSFAELQRLPASAIERVRSHCGWWAHIHVTRELRSDGQVLVKAVEVSENGFPISRGGSGSFLISPEGTTREPGG